eukprot:GHVR01052198.1.p1 GENE.GHVR01052198.1~~GHVR01052198.1.p1  ORF type:complete len:460 (-),score=69.89 GHVR01052198.1:264-1643(-)
MLGEFSIFPKVTENFLHTTDTEKQEKKQKSLEKLKSIKHEFLIHVLARTLIDFAIERSGLVGVCCCSSSREYLREVVSSTKQSHPELLLVYGNSYSTMLHLCECKKLLDASSMCVQFIRDYMNCILDNIRHFSAGNFPTDDFPYSCLIASNGAWVMRLVSSSPSASYFEYHESPYCPLETCLLAAKSNIHFFNNTRNIIEPRCHPGCSIEVLQNHFRNEHFKLNFKPLCTLHSVVLSYEKDKKVLKVPRTHTGIQLLNHCSQDKEKLQKERAAAVAAAKAKEEAAVAAAKAAKAAFDTLNELDQTIKDQIKEHLIAAKKKLSVAEDNLLVVERETATTSTATNLCHLANVLMEDADVFKNNTYTYWVLPLYDPLPALNLSGSDENWKSLAINRLISLVRQCSRAWVRGVAHNDLRVQNIVQDKYGNALAIDWDFGRFNIETKDAGVQEASGMVYGKANN